MLWELHQATDCKLETYWLGSSHWCVLFTQYLPKGMSVLSTIALQVIAHSSPHQLLDPASYSLHPLSFSPEVI